MLRVLKLFSKREELRKILSDTGVYTFANILRTLIAVALVPLYTRVLSLDEFGALEILTSMAGLVSLGLGLQLTFGIARFFHDENSQKQEVDFLSTFLWFRVIFYCAIILLLQPLGQSIAEKFLPVLARRELGVVLVFIAIIPLAIEDLLFFYLRLLDWRKRFVIFSVSSAVLKLILTLSFVMSGGGLMGVLSARLLGAFIIAIVLVWVLRGKVRFIFSPKLLKPVLLFSLPMAFGPMVGWAHTYLSRFIMADGLDLTRVAIYSLAVRVAMIANLGTNAFRMAWLPNSMKQINKPNGDSIFVGAAKVYVIISLFATTVLMLLSKTIVSLLATQEYLEASRLIPILALSVFVANSIYVFEIGNQIAKKTIWHSISRFLAAAVNISLAFLLLKWLDVLGIAMAMFIGSMISSAVIIISAQKNHPLPYPPNLFIVGTFSSLIIVLGSEIYWQTGYWVVNLIVCLIVSMSCWLILSNGERKKLLNALNVARLNLQTRYIHS